MTRSLFAAVLTLGILWVPASSTAAAPPPAARPRLTITPTRFSLADPNAEQQLVVSETLPNGRVVERTSVAGLVSQDPKVAHVSPQGLVTPVGDGSTRIRVRWKGGVTEALVTVRARTAPPPSFTRDVHPLLTHAGCSSGVCHGKAEGQNGFRLSLFGYDPSADYEAIARASGGRRVTRTDPARSLILLKATAQVPHGGGVRFRAGSRDYQVLARWIAAGTRYAAPDEPSLTRISVFPTEQLLPMNGKQRLLVTARYSDGSTRDVTREAKYASNNPTILSVDNEGRAQSRTVPGAAAVMANYQGLVAVSRILVPRDAVGPAPTMPPANSFIDRLVWNRLAKLRIHPSDPATDEEFLRRAYLDLIGTLPTPEEARAFLAECAAERQKAEGGRPKEGIPLHPSSLILHPSQARARLISRLLDRPEYAEFWALKWADVLRVDKNDLGAKGAYGFSQWLRAAVAGNMPYDHFVREIVGAGGSSAENGAVNLFRVLSKPDQAASSISQVFLGVRIECAQCHHHPFEKWSQDDYYGMVGFFTQLKAKPDGPASVLLTAGGSGEAVHPRTGQPVPPHALDAPPADLAGVADRRQRLAEWMTSPTNTYVPRMLVNRVWAHFMGRGLVEPVDDFRDTNPPSNPELLDALARDFVTSGYDVKRLIRTIMASRVYQLSSRSNPTNAGDEQNFSRAYPKRLMAEVLMDAIASASGVPPELPGLPRGTRAIEVWDSEWSTQWQSYFLSVFGRPARTHPCECERSQEPSIAQVLHLMNAPELQEQIGDPRGRARALADGRRPPKEIVEELFLAAYARRPTPKEEAEALKAFAGEDRDRAGAAEDVLWALMNTMEFVFNH